MCWIDALLDFWFGDRGLSAAAEERGRGSDSAELSIPKTESSAAALSPLPDPPEMYLRPELIPIQEPDGAAVEEAERVLRR